MGSNVSALALPLSIAVASRVETDDFHDRKTMDLQCGIREAITFGVLSTILAALI